MELPGKPGIIWKHLEGSSMWGEGAVPQSSVSRDLTTLGAALLGLGEHSHC